jgi:hypothetical protein
MHVPSALSAFSLGSVAAVSGFGVFFVTPYSRLFPGILIPGGALALGAFIAVRWAGARRSTAPALIALVPALALPVGMGSLLLLQGQSLNGWPVVALAACVISWVAGRLALLGSQVASE